MLLYRFYYLRLSFCCPRLGHTRNIKTEEETATKQYGRRCYVSRLQCGDCINNYVLDISRKLPFFSDDVVCQRCLRIYFRTRLHVSIRRKYVFRDANFSCRYSTCDLEFAVSRICRSWSWSCRQSARKRWRTLKRRSTVFCRLLGTAAQWNWSPRWLALTPSSTTSGSRSLPIAQSFDLVETISVRTEVATSELCNF